MGGFKRWVRVSAINIPEWARLYKTQVRQARLNRISIFDFERFEGTFPSLLSCSKNRFGQAPQ